MALPAFAPRDEEGFRHFLSGTPRALVLFQGTRCPYSATFRPHFEAAEAELPAWRLALRDLDEGDDAPWDARRVAVTPTVVAYVDGAEAARLEARPLLGLTRHRFSKWRKALPEPLRQ